MFRWISFKSLSCIDFRQVRLVGLLVVFAIPCEAQTSTPDEFLRGLLANQNVMPLAPVVVEPVSVIELGRSLFFDRELSGNRDVACASCHHPSLSSGDSREFPAGVGGHGLGSDRTQAEDRDIVPRNSPEVFQRGDEEWTSMFWDSRVAEDNGQFTSPAGPVLPDGFEDVLAIQAMFPVTSRAEMRGDAGDLDVFGQVNELAAIADGDLPTIWNALTNRLMAIPAYQQAFTNAYSDVPPDELGFEHAARAIAAFEKAAFSPRDSAWDRYVAGDDNALTAAAKRGATHFMGDNNCASCHSGSLMTDQQHHNIGVPQIGPGKDASGLDVGRALVTDEEADEFAFRTPPLRNAMLTGPWMHNGAFSLMEDAIRHYDPESKLADYDVSQLAEHLQGTIRFDQATVDALTAALDPKLPTEALTDDQVNDLMAFLFSLTSPSADLMLDITPDEVLSGIEVDHMRSSQIAVTYDPGSGDLQLVGEEGISLDALFLRISDDEFGTAASFSFTEGVAPWSSDEDIILSDELDAQSFLDYRTHPTFLFSAGDDLNAMLPSGLGSDDVAEHLTAAYRIHGSPELWRATVGIVPEPRSVAMLIAGAVCVAVSRRRKS